MSRYKQVKKFKIRIGVLKKKIKNLLKQKDNNDKPIKSINIEVTPEAYYKYMNQRTLLLLLKNKTIKFTDPLKFNDPMDSSIPELKLDINRLIDTILNELTKNYKGRRDLQIKFKNYLNAEIKWKKDIKSISDELLGTWPKIISQFRILSLTTKQNDLLM